MNQAKYVNKRQQVEVVITEMEYFGLYAQISRKGILGYEGEVSKEFVAKMIDKLDLTKVETLD
jgi:hypothetical protein